MRLGPRVYIQQHRRISIDKQLEGTPRTREIRAYITQIERYSSQIFILTIAYSMVYKKRKLELEDEPNNALVIELDKKKQVSVRKYNGVSLVDIREFYFDKETGEKKPGKKGISLTEDSYWKLVEAQSAIQSALVQLKEGGLKVQKTELTTKLSIEKNDDSEADGKSTSALSAKPNKKYKSAELVDEDDVSEAE